MEGPIMYTERHGRTTFVANADLSGDVTIHCDARSITIPADDLLAFLGSKIGDRMIRDLEDIDFRPVLREALDRAMKAEGEG